jgi:hypothetical protein
MGIIITRKAQIVLSRMFKTLDILKTFLFKIIRIEKYKVIAIYECPLGKLGSVSITKALSIGGRGIFAKYFKMNTNTMPTTTLANKKYAYLFFFLYNNIETINIDNKNEITNPPKDVKKTKTGFRNSILLE